MRSEFKGYLKSHPLAIEALYTIACLTVDEEVTSTYLARLMGRAVSTVYEILRELESNGMLKSRKDGVNRYFCPSVGKTEIRLIFDDKEVWEAFLKASSKLRPRVQPTVTEYYFKQRLGGELAKRFGGFPADTQVETFTGTETLDFLLEHTSKKVIGVKVMMMHPSLQYDVLGRILSLVKGPLVKEFERSIGKGLEKFQGRVEIAGLLFVFLLPQGEKFGDFDEWKFKELIRSLGTNRIKLEAVTEYATEFDLMVQPFIEKIANEIIQTNSLSGQIATT